MTNTRLTARLSIMSRQQGLTLLEMLVAVAILAIILTTVAPGIQNIVIKNRITSDLNNLSAVVQRARQPSQRRLGLVQPAESKVSSHNKGGKQAPRESVEKC